MEFEQHMHIPALDAHKTRCIFLKQKNKIKDVSIISSNSYQGQHKVFFPS